MCCLSLKIITKSVLWHLLATLFGENSKNVKQKVFSINFCCNTLQIMFIEYLEQKTMRTNIKNIFFSSVPKNYGKNSKKNDAKYSWAYKHNQDQPIKNINNKIFCSSLWVLSVGKAFFLPSYLRRIRRGESGKKGRTTPSDATHEIIVYGRSKTANVGVFFFRKLVFMVL